MELKEYTIVDAEGYVVTVEATSEMEAYRIVREQ